MLDALVTCHTPLRYLESYLSVQVDRSLGRQVRGHPLHVFQVFKRLVLYWPHIALALNTYVNLGQSFSFPPHVVFG